MSVSIWSKHRDKELVKHFAERTMSGEFYDELFTTMSTSAGVYDNYAPTACQQNITRLEYANLADSRLTLATNCTSLVEASLPKLVEIGQYSFDNCQNLERISAPVAATVGSCTFRNCTSLTTLNLPLLENVNTSAFENCTSLESISLPLLSPVQSQANALFRGCSSLKNVNLPTLQNILTNTFENCTSLENITLPALNGGDSTYLFQSMFKGCTSLKRVYLPSCNCSQLGGSSGDNVTFGGCTALEIFRAPSQAYTTSRRFLDNHPSLKLLDLGSITNIDTYFSIGAIVQTKILILRKADAVTTLAGTGGASATTTPTPIKVYVPSSLISEYESATNWSTLLAGNYVTFLALEGSPYEDPDFDDTAILNADRSTL